MCLASVYLKKNGENEFLAENVSAIKISGEKLTLVTLFRETTELKARIKEIDFTHSSVTLEPVGA